MLACTTCAPAMVPRVLVISANPAASLWLLPAETVPPPLRTLQDTLTSGRGCPCGSVTSTR